MHYNVPQFIDVEDKIAGPLTWKQLFWVIGLIITLVVLYNIFIFEVFLMIAIPLGLLMSAFAFYRPYGQPLITMMFYGISYLFGPKLFVWRRTPRPARRNVPKKKKGEEKPRDTKVITIDDINTLARSLDHPEDMMTESQKNDRM